MSKCDIRITFDREDRTYRGGDTVRGEVHISVNKDIQCNGVVLTYYWRTHGRGNRDTGTKRKLQLSESAPLTAGEELHLPFEFQAECWPLTFHGSYIYLDHYVHVGVDVPWAIDPKHEEEYILLPGVRPPEITGDRGEVISLTGGGGTEVKGIWKVLLYGFLGVILVMMSFAVMMLIPFLLVGGLGWWIWKTVIASRVGKVDLQIPHVVVAPGEELPVQLAFTPKKTFSVNGIHVKLICRESATSGSGTNKTTHHNTLIEQTFPIREAGSLLAGQRVDEQVLVQLPETQAWSLATSDNKVTWYAETRIDIPRFPDWSQKTNLQMLPGEFLDSRATSGPPPTLESHDPLQELDHISSLVAEEDDSWSGAARESVASAWSTSDGASNSSWDDSPSTNDGAAMIGESLGPLIALLDSIKAAGRFSTERSAVAEAAAGHVYELVLEIERISTTFGFTGDDPRYEYGRTLLGRIFGTDHEVQLFTLDDSNEALRDLSKGDTWSTLVRVEQWDSLYDRLVLHEVAGA